jgi:flagellar basal-body rod protein FlgF
MQNTTDIALSRLIAQQRAMDVTANNIANADTPGFKAERVLFSTWLSRQKLDPQVPGERTIDYAQDRATYRDNAAGALQTTGNPLDLALAGEGYFTVQTTQGVRLTRAGRFSLMPDGTIADLDGNPLMDTQGRKLQISPGETDLSVAGDGTLSTRNGTVGRIAVVTADTPYALRAQGGRLFDPGGSPLTPVAAPHITQGALEDSNVQPVVELATMMSTLREFQYVAGFVQSESDRMSGAIEKITHSSTGA